MKSYALEALDPLVLGTGKPFSAIPGSRVESRLLPMPSTLAGMVRSTVGRGSDGRFDRSRIDELLDYTVRGPLLVNDKQKLLAPVPADALRFHRDSDQPHQNRHVARPLRPLQLAEGDAVSDVELAPVGQSRPDPSKPPRGLAPLWSVDRLLEWLTSDDVLDLGDDSAPRQLAEEVRTHVAIGADGTASDGALFSTVGRRFAGLQLHFSTDAPLEQPVHVVLGGEGRLSRVERSHAALPEVPAAVLASARAGHVRLYFLTPAACGDSRLELEGATVVAQASGRPEVVSGWAMASQDRDEAAAYPAARESERRRSGPKPVRRLLPAGSVFFLRLDGGEDEREAWARRHWANSIHAGQDGRDGFGWALLGTWDGTLQTLHIEDAS